MALSHFGARHFAAWHFGTLQGQAATTTRVPVHRHPWIHQQPPVSRRVRTWAWAEQDLYAPCAAWQIAPAQLARSAPLVEQDCFSPLSARRQHRASSRPMHESPAVCRQQARGVYHAKTKPALAIEPRVRLRARRGLPNPAVLNYFLREIV